MELTDYDFIFLPQAFPFQTEFNSFEKIQAQSLLNSLEEASCSVMTTRLFQSGFNLT